MIIEDVDVIRKRMAILEESIHKAMGRTADCDKKQTIEELAADVAFLKRLANDHYAARVRAEQKYANLVLTVPPPDKLELLARWFDLMYQNDTNPEVQNDLRTWAKNINRALSDG